VSGSVDLELADSAGVPLYSMSESVSLSGNEIRELDLAADPSVTPGVYVMRGSWQEDGKVFPFFEEYISIDAAHVVGQVLLEGQGTHSGISVQLGNEMTTTFADGSYALVGVPFGVLELSASHAGHVSHGGNVTVGPGTLTLLEPVMLPLETYPPQACFNFSPACPCGASGTLLEASCSSDADGTIVSYEWDFGDGSTATGESVRHSYAIAGEYPVVLSVTDSDGHRDTSSQLLPVGVCGDANEDGAIDGRDVIRCKKIILGIEEETCGADANEDCVIDGRDVVRIKKMILGIE
jgi:hypothetical protein